MHHRRPVRYARLKVVLLFAIFAAPIVTAWGMVTWNVGSQGHTAHGKVTIDVPPLEDWPLMASITPLNNGRWY